MTSCDQVPVVARYAHAVPARFPLIIGPTAGGKSSLALAIADEASARRCADASSAAPAAEIVSADAFAVYRGLDIGTAKPSAAERARVPHHLIDIADPREAFTAHDWLARAEAAIADIRSRGVLPIVVGGTHLYARALLEGLFEGPPPDPALRAGLLGVPLAELRARLEREDPAAAARIHRNDLRRTVRALEVLEQTGRPISAHQRQWSPAGTARPDALLVALQWSAEALNPRINARVRRMIEEGLVEEAQELWRGGRLGPTAGEALGYKQLVAHFEGRCSLADAIERIKIDTRRFAKQQRTWLRRLSGFPGCVVVPGERAAEGGIAQAIVNACLSD